MKKDIKKKEVKTMPECPYCHEEKSTRGFAVHMRNCLENPNRNPERMTKPEGSDKANERIHTLEKKMSSIEANFDEELDDLYARIEVLEKPKGKNEEKEPEWECTGCGEKFNELIKYCPHCGKEFDVKPGEA